MLSVPNIQEQGALICILLDKKNLIKLFLLVFVNVIYSWNISM